MKLMKKGVMALFIMGVLGMGASQYVQACSSSPGCSEGRICELWNTGGHTKFSHGGISQWLHRGMYHMGYKVHSYHKVSGMWSRSLYRIENLFRDAQQYPLFSLI